MTSSLYPGQGAVKSSKGDQVWTDLILIGGSTAQQSGDSVGWLWGSGTSLYAGFVAYGCNKNNYMDYGASGTSAGSDRWVSYTASFGAAPKVFATMIGNDLGGIAVGSVGTGSFYVTTGSASKNFNWYAIGQKA